MASIQKVASGYRAQLYVLGAREARTFRTKREAVAWAAQREAQLRDLATKPSRETRTVRQLLHRYLEEVTPTKRGARWETIRIQLLLRDPAFPNDVILGRLTPEMLGIWRDARLQVVSPGTVLRDMTVISGALETARREWRWLDDNPMRLIRKPRQPDHRDRIPTWQELKALLRAMAYSPCHPVRRVSQAVAVAMLFALRTGMRAGEISGLTWDRVNTDHVWLPVTKTKPRAVPLTRKAVRLLQKMQDYDPVLVFGMNAASLDANFRKYRKRAGVEGLHFHDTRHAAATMLARKVDALTLCKIFGWTHTTQALTYYNPSASELAQLLERPAARGRSR